MKEKWLSDSREVWSEWISGDDLTAFQPYAHVYGICFTSDGQVVVIKDRKKWTLPGGRPEAGETAEETLRREADEEASLELGTCKLIGAFEVYFPGNPDKNQGERFYQLRYAAVIKEIKELTEDPDKGRSWQRKVIPVEEFSDYVQWGEHGKKMFREAHTWFSERERMTTSEKI